MSKIKNLNSRIVYHEKLEEQLIKRLDFLLDKFWNIPVYLVDEPLMDFLYPPQKRRVLNDECVKEILNVRTDKDNMEEIFERLNRCRNKTMVAVGLYKPGLSPEESQEIENRTGHHISDRETIYICPERIDNWAQKYEESIGKPVQGAYDIIFQMLLIHELVHAYMNDSIKSRYANELWYSIIEESMANAVAFKHFLTKEKKIISWAMSTQPLEYRGYVYWIPVDERDIAPLARLWKMIMLSHSCTRYLGWFDYNDWYYRWRFWRIGDIPENEQEKIMFLKELAFEILKSVL